MRPTSPDAVFETHLPGIPLRGRGKVRDVYEIGDALLIVATDRLSAFDYVLPNPIPDKGKVLNQISLFWFGRTAPLVPNHVITADPAAFPEPLRPHARLLDGRATLVRKLAMVPVECVARGYLAGSGWKEYLERGTVCGITLPPGLRESDRLPEPIFTPATKAETGHDENIPFVEVERRVGKDLARDLRDRTLDLYRSAAAYALDRGIIIADTKFEFGLEGGRLIVADEMLTPDSSRFWPVSGYAPGRGRSVFPPISSTFDKDAVYGSDGEMSLGWNVIPFDVPNFRSENGKAVNHVRIGWLRSVANIYH
ncbi:MAG: phosphoribosylaminoimidazolesuccinocarboxamide synthase, partial [Acidobacteriia bacterium]|nr:phosphoribosylaminoimidazolesuccinocarboxamide synthase [Terriglobia bacterium]